MAITSNTVMNQGNFPDVLAMRTDIIYSALMDKKSAWDVEKSAALGRQHARAMISSIVKNYNIKPVEASDAFHSALNAWEMAHAFALNKITFKITFTRSRGQNIADLETNMKPILMAYFEAGKELTERILRDLAEEVYGWEDETEGKELKDGKSKSDVASVSA